MSNMPDTRNDLQELPVWSMTDSSLHDVGTVKDGNPDSLGTTRATSSAVPARPIDGDVLPPAMSDETLLDNYRRGDRASFAKLMARHQRELFHFLVRFVGNRASAEDIFQETFLQVHRSATSFDTTRRFRTWLFTIAANKARDLLRSQQRHPVSPLLASVSPGDDDSGQFIDFVPAGGELPGESMERRELAQRVRSTVMDMPGNLREILLLSYFNQFPYNQISDILGIPLGTVKSRLHSAVAEFGNRWESLNKTRH